MKKILIVFIAILISACTANANNVKITALPGSNSILANKKQIIPLQIELVADRIRSSEKRSPVNISLVLDRSGSMSGEKLEQAKESAITAIELLGKEDIVSVVIYDGLVSVVVPSTKLSDKKQVYNKIRGITVGGSTALYAGVSKGAGELRKFFSDSKVNRVILLSDGNANVGPKSPGELGQLGVSLAKEGISVSTIGLGIGYNEELMTRLADRSDGNHAFVETADELVRIFENEFDDIVSVAANNIDISIELTEGFRPVRILGREGDIHGRKVFTSIGQLYSSRKRFVVLEVESLAQAAGTEVNMAKIKVSYKNLIRDKKEGFSKNVRISFVKDSKLVESSLNKSSTSAHLQLLANENSKRAVKLADMGKFEEARELIQANVIELEKHAEVLGDKELRRQSEYYKDQGRNVSKSTWEKGKRDITQQNYSIGKQIDPARFNSSYD